MKKWLKYHTSSSQCPQNTSTLKKNALYFPIHRRLRDLGLLHHEAAWGRTFILIQYWRSMDHLMDYAKNKDAEHLPAWKEFNQKIGKDGAVGIWHETYAASNGTYENIYAHMPPFGLGKAGTLQRVQGKRESARGRLSKE